MIIAVANQKGGVGREISLRPAEQRTIMSRRYMKS